MSDSKIREAVQGDAPALADFLIALGIMPWLRTATRDQVVLHLGGKLSGLGGSTAILVAVDATHGIVGYGSATWIPNLLVPGMEGYVSELFVSEAQRGKGIGTRLLDTLEAMARDRGCVRLSLLNLEERESYRRGFYPKRAWSERTGARNMLKTIKPNLSAPPSIR